MKENQIVIKNFHCSEHGYIKPTPECPKCHQLSSKEKCKHVVDCKDCSSWKEGEISPNIKCHTDGICQACRPPSPLEWEKKFIKKYGKLLKKLDNEFQGDLEKGLYEDLKDFIRQTLSLQQNHLKEEWKEEVRQMEKGIEWMQEGRKKDLKGYTKGYNQAIDDVINSLTL